MTYITGLNSISKGEIGEIYFNKEAFIFATDFAADTYFANDLNWKRIALYFTDSTASQKQVIVLKDDFGRGWFAPSVTARTGEWSIEKINIFDKDGDFFTVERSNMPDPDSFAVEINRVIAPASAIVSAVFTEEKVSNGTFDTNYLGWVAGSNATISQESGVLRVATIDGTGINNYAEQVLVTVPGLRYKVSWKTIIPSEGYSSQIEIIDASENVLASQSTSAAGEQTLVTTFVATGTSPRVRLSCPDNASAGAYNDFDDISVMEYPYDVTVTEGEGTLYGEGYKVLFWDASALNWLSETIYEIVSIDGDTITLDTQLPEAFEGKNLSLRFPSYANVTGEQSSKYVYVSSGY